MGTQQCPNEIKHLGIAVLLGTFWHLFDEQYSNFVKYLNILNEWIDWQPYLKYIKMKGRQD